MAKLNLAELLVGEAAGQGGVAGRVAVRESGRSWTYAELADKVARLAAGFAGLGIARGDRVAVLMPDGIDAAAAILAVIHAGAVAVPIHELGRPNDIRAVIRDAGAVVAVVHSSLEPVLEEIRAEVECLREVVVAGTGRQGQRTLGDLIASSEPASPAATDGTDLALLLYSTGPSDRPRGVPHRHETPVLAYDSFAKGALELTPDDRVLSLAKLATAYGLGSGLLFPLRARAQALFLAEQARSLTVFDLLKTLDPTVLFATPSLYSQFLVDVGPDAGSAHRMFAGLRAAFSGAETMPARLEARIKHELGLDVLGGFGLTEAFHFVIANPPGRARPGSTGLVLPGYEARVVDDEGKPSGPQEIGSLEVRGPTLARGYWNRSEESQQIFRGGWMRTVDRFLVDNDGYFFHCGRADDMFKVSGKWVSPAEVERTLLAHDAVWECAVVGVEDDDGLTKPAAFVVPNVGQTPGQQLERTLIEYVKREIAPYKYPRWIEFLQELPKGANGKVLRYKLHWKPRRSAHKTLPP
jgi:benzoate-CoA ligase family protein